MNAGMPKKMSMKAHKMPDGHMMKGKMMPMAKSKGKAKAKPSGY